MEISSESLRRYYGSLPDEALLELDPSDLTEVARACYLDELARRNLKTGPDRGRQAWQEEDESSEPQFDGEADFAPEEGWLEDAVCVCAFDARTDFGSPGEAERAREVLEAAQIPCHVAMEQLETQHGRSMPQYEYRVMVPAALSLEATSVLDTEIFNPKLEAEWKTHFEHLSDDELRAFSAESLCAGLLDRAARLKRAYLDEIARRKSRQSR